MRQLAAFSGAVAALALSGCSLNVDWREDTPIDGPEPPPIHLPVYPRATRLAAPIPSRDDISFSGRFTDTGIQSAQFATDDGVDGVLRFYRGAMRAYGEPLACRGTLHVHANRRSEEVRCLREASDSVQLVVSVPGHHAIVSVTPVSTRATFTLINVTTRH